MINRLRGYWKRAWFEYSQYRWRCYFRSCRQAFVDWQRRFTSSDAQVLLGAHFHRQGGVRNHLLAIKKYSALKVMLVPEESDLQQPLWPAPINENEALFLETQPPSSAIAVHTHVLPTLINWAARHAPGRMRWIHTHHAMYQNEDGAGGVLPWQQKLNDAMLYAAENCHVCLCVSRWEQRQLTQRYNVTSQYLPNGVDVQACDQGNGDRFRKRFRLHREFLLWVGRLDPVKNPRAFVELAIRLPETQCVMVGGITEQDVVHEYGLEVPANLTLLTQLTHSEVLDAIAACRVLVVTSFREGLPTLVLEAMTLRRPIVVPEEAGCLDATDGDQCAAVYQPQSIDDLVDKTRRMFHTAPPNENGRRRVLAEFDWRVVAARLDDIYLGRVIPGTGKTSP